MPATRKYRADGACDERCLRRGRGCLQATFCRACGACGEEEDRAPGACDPICEEIKFKEKTRSCLNQTGSDFSLNLTWPAIYGACAGQVNDEARRGKTEGGESEESKEDEENEEGKLNEEEDRNEADNDTNAQSVSFQ